MFDWLSTQNTEQRKSLADAFGTLSRLFLAGALVGPFVNGAEIGPLTIGAALLAGIAFQLITLYILRTRDEDHHG
ncbi:MAG: hypothetical protein QNI84_11020 [Henriciella sp.]|nr:hypothetical protein [Henriciella sp.]